MGGVGSAAALQASARPCLHVQVCACSVSSHKLYVDFNFSVTHSISPSETHVFYSWFFLITRNLQTFDLSFLRESPSFQVNNAA